jgi:hypothetical protein
VVTREKRCTLIPLLTIEAGGVYRVVYRVVYTHTLQNSISSFISLATITGCSDVSLSILNLLRKMYINLFQVLVNPMDAEGTIPAVVIIGAVLQVCCSVCVCVPCVCVQCVQCVYGLYERCVCVQSVQCVRAVASTVVHQTQMYFPCQLILTFIPPPSFLLPPSSKGDRRGGADVTMFL